MSLVAGLLWPRLFSSKLSKLKVTEKYSGSATVPVFGYNESGYETQLGGLNNVDTIWILPFVRLRYARTLSPSVML
jgi:hypothetical protein